MRTSDALYEAHPYLKAEDGIKRGDMHSATAVGLILSDRDFIAEYALSGEPHEIRTKYALAIVHKWQAERVQK